MLNLFEMLASLKLGVDIEPITPPNQVPHVFQSGYIPAYTLRDEDGKHVGRGIDVCELVEQAHQGMSSITLYEDEYPVFTVHQ